MTLAIVVLVPILVLLSAPIVTALGVGALANMLGDGLTTQTFAQAAFGGLSDFTLLAIPLFVLTGEILMRSGASARLVRFITMLVGWLPGGLGMSAVCSTMVFSGLSGSVNADAAAIGSVMIRPMEQAGYRREWAAAIVGAAAGTGVLIPPSITMIVLGTIANLSIRDLFLASLLPAAIVGIAKMVVIYWHARLVNKRDADRSQERERVTGKQLLRAFADAIPPLITVVIILGGILGGVFTATEAAAIAVIYVSILAVCYRTVRWRQAGEILVAAGRTSGIVLALIAAASALSHVLAFDQAQLLLSDWASGFTDHYFIFISIVILIFWVLGALMDGIPALVVLIPLFMPLAQQAGISQLHFAIFSLAVFGISLVTPPLGTACFIVTGVARTTMAKLFKPMTPFIVVLVAVMLLLAYVPGLSLWLPHLVSGG